MNTPNLNTLPTIEDVQAVIDQSYADFGPSYAQDSTPLFALGNNGASALFIPINDEWGFKLFYHVDCYVGDNCSAESCLATNLELHEMGLAAYAHGMIETVKARGKVYKGFFVQRCKVCFCYDEMNGHANFKAVKNELGKLGLWDIKPANMGLTPDNELVLIDCSHRITGV